MAGEIASKERHYYYLGTIRRMHNELNCVELGEVLVSGRHRSGAEKTRPFPANFEIQLLSRVFCPSSSAAYFVESPPDESPSSV